MGCSIDEICTCTNFPLEKLTVLRTSENKWIPICASGSSYLLPTEETRHDNKMFQRQHLYICQNIKDFCKPHENDFFKIIPGFRFQRSKQHVLGIQDREKVAIFTCPKIGGFNFAKSVKNSKSSVKLKISRCKHITERPDKNISSKTSGITLCGRQVCETVKELIKDVVVSDMSEVQNITLPPDFEWVTVESLIKEISSMTRCNSSNATINETEVHSELLNNPGVKIDSQDGKIDDKVLTKNHRDKHTSLSHYLFFNNLFTDSPQCSKENSVESFLSNTVKCLKGITEVPREINLFQRVREKMQGLI